MEDGTSHFSLWEHLPKMSCKNSFPTFPPAPFIVNIMGYGSAVGVQPALDDCSRRPSGP